ncbi:hypothetical protein [Fastidiosibacter lacustris]|uniref:hypothetical protein n=1 Tax=Fastidiosibacter lacustris TaxID=2056695 RepID=UPI000E3453A5|nr:hypothetical protein [Fastidiosibacter lacustris]
MQITEKTKRWLFSMYNKQSIVTVKSHNVSYVGVLKHISFEYVMLEMPFGVKKISFADVDKIIEHSPQ